MTKQKREVLNDIYITSQITGENVPLTQIADIVTESSMNKIVRRDEKRTLTVGLFVEEGYNTQTVMKSCQQALQDYELPEGYSIVFGGESEENKRYFFLSCNTNNYCYCRHLFNTCIRIW